MNPLIAGIMAGGAVFSGLMAIYFLLERILFKRITQNIVQNWFQQTRTIRWSDSLADRLDNLAWSRKMESELKRAAIKLRPSEYGALLIASIFGVYVLLRCGMDAPLWLCLLAATWLPPLGSKLLLKSRRFLYIQKVDSQLSEACRLLSSAARAGLSIPQGLELVVQELPDPIREELGIVVKELQLGKDLELALKDFLKRVNSRDLQVFVNALIIQKRAGGDVAKVLSQMASTMEERKIIHKTIDATIAQARYSAYLLPFVSLFIVFLLSRLIDNFFELFTNFIGVIVLLIFVILQVIGFLLVRKIANVRV